MRGNRGGKTDGGTGRRQGKVLRRELVRLSELKPHEETDGKKVQKLARDLKRNGQREPLLVDARHGVILDGHHRAKALKKIGETHAHALLVDYSGQEVKLSGRRPGVPVSKRLVVQRALQKRPFPPKTTRHELEINL